MGVDRRLTFALVLVVSHAAYADTLIGPNGERLPGHVVEQKDGLLVFQSDFLGRVQVRADRARVERTEAATPPPSPTDRRWTADLGGKLTVDRGSLKTAEDDFDATLKLVRNFEQGELHATVDYNYKRTAGELKDDDWLGSLSYDHFLSPRRFTAGRLLVTTDLTSEGYERTDTLSLATGWRLWETPDRYLRIGPALGYLSMTRGDNRFNGAALGLYARAKGPLLGRTTFSSELQMLDSFGDGRYANLEFRLRHPLGQRFYLALAWNYNFSDFDIESGIKSEWRWEIGWRLGPDP